MSQVGSVPAGLLLERGGPVVIEDVLISPPGPGEVLRSVLSFTDP